MRDSAARLAHALGVPSGEEPPAYFAEDIGRKLAPERAPAPPPAILVPAPQTTGAGRAAPPSGAQRVARKIAERSWKRERSKERQQKRDRKFFEQRKAELEAEHGDAFDEGAIIPADVWRTCWQIVDDRTGRAAAHALHQLPTAYRGALWRAFAGRRWESRRARRICALTFGLYTLRRRARRPSRWGFRVDNIAVNALCVLLREWSTGHTPGRTAMSGTHRPDANLSDGQFGYLNALREVGIVYRLQRRQCADNPSCNQYWLLDPHSGYTNAAQRAFAADLARDAVFLQAPGGARAPPIGESSRSFTVAGERVSRT